MNKSGLAFSLLVMAATAGFAQGPPEGGGWGRGPRMAGPQTGWIAAGPGTRVPVTGAPYSGVETTQIQQTLADGNLVSRQETAKVSRDGQGRVRMEQTMTPPGAESAVTRISIFDPVAGYSHVLNPASQTGQKFLLRTPGANGPAGGERGAGRGGPGSMGGTTQTTDLGTQTVNGQAANGTRVTTTIPAGTFGNQQPVVVVRETWVSIALKVPVQIKTSDPRFGTTTMNLTGIVQSEPDPALFQVPANYSVTTIQRGAGGPGRGPAMHGEGAPRN